MPELPEVEITRIGITPHLIDNIITSVRIYNSNLRWPISPELLSTLPKQKVFNVERRGKHLLIKCESGVLLIHLGMTGFLRIVSSITDQELHDHFDIAFKNGTILRLNDVRRFGSVFWAGTNPYSHIRLAGLGPEPLTDDFSGTYLYNKSRSSKVTIKQCIMDHKTVAGIGNIYANEALFHAGIRPTVQASSLSKVRTQKLVTAIKDVLTNSISVGGTMLDFRDGTEKQGDFHKELAVYRRNGQPCVRCATPIQLKRVGTRSNYYCKVCQH